MAGRTNRAEDILKVTERLVRVGGYHGFSIRDVADAVGVKTAAVHYHFASKSDLVEAVAHRYTERFFQTLGEAEAPGALERLRTAFRQALLSDGLVCLCGVLASEAAVLPDPVKTAAKRFMQQSLLWMERAGLSEVESLRALALLEGAMLTAKGLEDPSAFDRICPAGVLAPVTRAT